MTRALDALEPGAQAVERAARTRALTGLSAGRPRDMRRRSTLAGLAGRATGHSVARVAAPMPW